jgi:hypothetical protein
MLLLAVAAGAASAGDVARPDVLDAAALGDGVTCEPEWTPLAEGSPGDGAAGAAAGADDAGGVAGLDGTGAAGAAGSCDEPSVAVGAGEPN